MTTLSDWQRIEKAVHYTGFTVNAFAANIGLQRSENLYQIKRGNNGISKSLADIITKRYPEINRVWLLTGDGEMLVGDNQQNSIPCLDADISYIALASQMPTPSYMVSLPRMDNADFGAMSLSGSLAPDIPVGVTLFVKRIEAQDIIFGESYLVVLRQGVLLRTVRQSEDSGLLLTATNAAFDTIQVAPSDILKLYAVKGFIKINH